MASNNDNRYEGLKNVLFGVLFLIAGWQWQEQQKLEERVFTLSATAMTDTKAQALEDRLNKNMDNRFNDLGGRVDFLVQLVKAMSEKK
jgi:hypothetical protein